MTNYIGGIVGSTVTGDGNIAGDGNSVRIDKSRNTHYHGSGYGGGRGRSSSTGDDGAVVIALAILLSVAVAGAAYLFARYAYHFYAVAFVVAGLQAFSSATAVIADISSKRPILEDWREWLAFILALGMTALIYLAWQAYPQDAVAYATSAVSTKEFWCALPMDSRGAAIQHMVAAIAVSVCLLANIPHASAGFFGCLFGEDTPVSRVSYRVATVGLAVFAVTLAALSWFVLFYLESSVFATTAWPIMSCGIF